MNKIILLYLLLISHVCFSDTITIEWDKNESVKTYTVIKEHVKSGVCIIDNKVPGTHTEYTFKIDPYSKYKVYIIPYGDSVGRKSNELIINEKYTLTNNNKFGTTKIRFKK